MKIGKLSESILDRSVFKVLHRNNSNILCKPKAGMGYQLVHMDDGTILAATMNMVEGTAFQVGTLSVPRAQNSLACTGAKPIGIMLSLTIPESVTEHEFRKMMHDIDSACLRENVEVIGGHTQVSSGVSRVIASVTAFGTIPHDSKVFHTNDSDKGLQLKSLYGKPGQDIVMTKWAGMSGSWILEQKYHHAFVQKYNTYICDQINEMKNGFSVCKEARIAHDLGIHALFDLSEGGVFGGLWEAAQGAHAGLRVDLKSIPIRQETVELCDYIDVNPYLIPSVGSLLIAADHGDQLVNILRRHSIPAAVIGCFTDNNDRVIINDDEVRYLEPPRGSVVDLWTERND